MNNTAPAPADPHHEIVPMENFSLVCPGVYRSAFPLKKNFGLLKRLKLRSILTLILYVPSLSPCLCILLPFMHFMRREDYPLVNVQFNTAQDIKLFQFGMDAIHSVL